MVAWNIDYERDSEEVVFLKKHIAEQGSERLISSLSLVHSLSITTSDSHNSTLQGQLLKAKNALEDNKTSLDETTRKVRHELLCIYRYSSCYGHSVAPGGR